MKIDNNTGKEISNSELTFVGEEKSTKEGLPELVDSIRTHTEMLVRAKKAHATFNGILKDIHKNYYNHHFTLTNIDQDLIEKLESEYQSILNLISESERLYDLNIKVFFYSNPLTTVSEELLQDCGDAFQHFSYEFMKLKKWSYALKLNKLGCKSIKNI